MARPKKIGLDYFPLNCQMNDKVVLLEKAHGLLGFATYIKLLQKIYKTEEGRLDLSDPKQTKLLARSLLLSLEDLLAMVETMCDLDLFEEQTFRESKVLTSNGVRKRLGQVDALRRKRRDSYGNNQEKQGFQTGETGFQTGESTQREREIERESLLENKSSTTSTTGAGEESKPSGFKRFCVPDQPTFTPPTVEDVVSYFKENGGAEAEAKIFHERYSLFEWIRNDGFYMFSWKGTALSWIRNNNESKSGYGSKQKPQMLPRHPSVNTADIAKNQYLVNDR